MKSICEKKLDKARKKVAIPDYICGSKYENMNNNQVMMVVGSQVKSVRIPSHFLKPHK